MKKIFQCLALLNVCLLLIPSFPLRTQGNDLLRLNLEPQITNIEFRVGEITYNIDGQKKYFSYPAFIYQNRTMVPLLFISDGFGALINFDRSVNGITITSINKTMVMIIDKKEVVINGKYQTLDISPVLQEDQPFVPLRFLVENLFELSIAWEPSTQKIMIFNKINPESKTISVEITVGDPIPIVDGIKQSHLESSPYIWRGRMMVGPRLLSEVIGFKIDYNRVDDTLTTLTFSNPKVNLVMTYNSSTAIVNGKEVAIDVPFDIRNNRSQVPLRFIMETFETTVTWDPTLHKTSIVYEIPEN
jgi:hypothetical protein